MSLDSASVEAKPTTEEPSKETPEQPLGLSQDEAEYPPAKTVALIVLALYLALFLVALVSRQSTLGGPRLTEWIGSNYYIDGHPSDYRRLSFSWRCGLVWKCISHH